MNLLMISIINIFIPIFVVLLVIAITCAMLVLAAENDIESDKYLKARGKERTLPISSLNVFEEYCQDEKCCDNVYKFINVLYEIFPRDFIIVPNVGLGKLIKNYSSIEDYNKKVLTKTADIGIFYKNSKPLVMIDLIDNNSDNPNMKRFTNDIAYVLQSINIPVVEVVMKKRFDLHKLKHELFKIMPKKIMKKYL